MKRLIGYQFTLQHRMTSEIISAQGMTKTMICSQRGLNTSHFVIIAKVPIYETIHIQTNLTNAQLIALLSTRDPSASVDIFVDYDHEDDGGAYPEIEEECGVCYAMEDDRIVIKAYA